MPDWVYIRGLTVQTRIGAFAWERDILQSLSFDVDLQTDIRPAARSDDLGDALDYNAVSQRIKALVEAAEFALIETLLEAIARMIIREFAVPRVRLRVDKTGALPGAQSVGLQIERQAADYA